MSTDLPLVDETRPRPSASGIGSSWIYRTSSNSSNWRFDETNALISGIIASEKDGLVRYARVIETQKPTPAPHYTIQVGPALPRPSSIRAIRVKCRRTIIQTIQVDYAAPVIIPLRINSATRGKRTPSSVVYSRSLLS